MAEFLLNPARFFYQEYIKITDIKLDGLRGNFQAVSKHIFNRI